MAPISQLKKSELYKLATEPPLEFPHEESETTREELIEFLRAQPGIVDPSKVNRQPSPTLQQGNPSITSDGKKIKLTNDLFAELDQLPTIAELIDRVMSRASELWRKPHPVSIERYCEIASLVISACTHPDAISLNVIINYRGAALRAKFYTVTHRAVLAVLRNEDRQYGSAVQVAILDIVSGLKDHKEFQAKLLAEVQQVKNVKGAGGESVGSESNSSTPPNVGTEDEVTTQSGERGGDPADGSSGGDTYESGSD